MDKSAKTLWKAVGFIAIVVGGAVISFGNTNSIKVIGGLIIAVGSAIASLT